VDILRDWGEINRIVDELLELSGPDRARRMAELRASSPDLEPLLAAVARDEERGDEWLAALRQEVDSAGADADRPVRIGAYRILGELGHGGMGRVYLAERAEGSTSPRVAIKVLDAGSGSLELQRRFERERATLARLDHPHIARWLDGGVTGDGQPFLVMEHVDGRPIDRHCDDRRASIEDRLRLFLEVCAAVEYAHQQLVLHRDLKPSNVFVGADGRVKLLDFGIAKWLETLDGEHVHETTSMLRVLTPSWAAPEQIRGEPSTTATDVYQLGLLLYLLLTGWRVQTRAGASAEPPRPSRVAAGAVAGPDLAPIRVAERARARGLSPYGLARRLAGDLDAMVLEALQPSPAARYHSVEALRRDVESVLDGRPVVARQGSFVASARRTIARHPVAAAVAGTLVISGMAAVGLLALQARTTAAERDRARAAEARAAAINRFLVDELLVAGTPERARGRAPTVEEVLANAARSVGHALKGQPEVEAAVRDTLAGAYAALGQPRQAREHGEAADRLLAANVHPDDPVRLRSRARLAGLLIAEARYAEAEAALPALVAAQRERLGAAHPDTLATRGLLGRVLREAGKMAASENELTRAVADAEGLEVGHWRVRAQLWADLASTQLALGKAQPAEALALRLADERRARLGPDHPDLAVALSLLARVRTSLLKYREAVVTGEEVAALHERIYGKDHTETGRAYMRLGTAYSRFNDEVRSVQATERAHAIFQRTLGPDHPDTVMALRNLGVGHKYAGDLAAAGRAYRDVLESRRRTLGDGHRDTLEALGLVQLNLADQKRDAEARRMGRDLIARYDAATRPAAADPLLIDDHARLLLGITPPDLRDPARAAALAARAVAATRRQDYLRLRTLGEAQIALGRRREAMATIGEALALPPAIQSWTLESLYVDLLREFATPAEVERWLVDRVAQFGRAGRPDDFLAGRTLRFLAELEEREGRPAEAERRYREALAQFRKTAPDAHWLIGLVKSQIGGLLVGQRRFAEAEPLLREAWTALIEDGNVRPEFRQQARDRLVVLYEATGRPAEAARWRTRSTAGPDLR
jgi:serine/threonine-protein kinase